MGNGKTQVIMNITEFIVEKSEPKCDIIVILKRQSKYLTPPSILHRKIF